MSLNTDYSKKIFDYSSPQLPIASYTSSEVYAIEAQYLFPHAPQYIGSKTMVPNLNDYYVLDWQDKAKALVNTPNGISLLSNICRHRQAIMLDGAGRTKNIVCPLHHWVYNLSGELIAAPHFDQKPCLKLDHQSLQEWQGLLFKENVDINLQLQALNHQPYFDFSHLQLDRVQIDDYNFNWKTFIEVYLEDYHVAPFHPGLNEFVNCRQLDWQFNDHFSLQTLGLNKDSSSTKMTPAYQHWKDVAINNDSNHTQSFGAIWLAYYPFLMIEWYPNTLVVSHIIPKGVNHCQNVTEFYYPKSIIEADRPFIQAQQAAYFETAQEDKEICQRMHNGRLALYQQSRNEYGPYQYPMEAGLDHFHQWYQQRLAKHLSHLKL
jgi:choline monooxygenase